MNHITYVGLDVHARSTYASAFDPMTGEVTRKLFDNDLDALLAWMLDFPDPCCVYESGCTGFNMARYLTDHGVPCSVAATARLQRPATDKRRKNDWRDAEFLARALATNNVVEVFVPDVAAEAARDLCRLQEDLRNDITRAKHRLTHFLLRKGYVFDSRKDNGECQRKWTKAHWDWMDSIRFESEVDAKTYAFYRAEVRHLEMSKRKVEDRLHDEARGKRWATRVRALSMLRGVGELTAFALTCEAVAFSRFESAQAFWTWCGMAPSEHISDGHGPKGPITKTGNSHARTLLTESAWHFVMPGTNVPKVDKDSVPSRLWNHALKGNKRLADKRRHLIGDLHKHPCAANTATARELAGWVWALGCMAEGTL